MGRGRAGVVAGLGVRRGRGRNDNPPADYRAILVTAGRHKSERAHNLHETQLRFTAMTGFHVLLQGISKSIVGSSVEELGHRRYAGR